MFYCFISSSQTEFIESQQILMRALTADYAITTPHTRMTISDDYSIHLYLVNLLH